jgi:site-specific DNA-methyltransferase (adenine-specific)
LPEPYYEDEHVTIYHGDCEDVLAHLDVDVQLVLTDPPYGINFVSNHRTKRTHIAKPIHGDDTNPVHLVPLLHLLLVDDGAIYWFCVEDGIHEFNEAAVDAGLHKKRALVWDKGNWASGDLTGDWGVQTEYIAWAANEGHKLRDGRPANLLSVPREASGSQDFKHPSQKPVTLLEKIIRASSDPGGVVLDPYMGSGSTLRAAVNLGRRAIGIEVDEGYCEVAKTRMAQMGFDLGGV